MPTEQEILIGIHPDNSHFIGTWLHSEDVAVTADKPNKKHRKLKELAGQRQNAINEIAKWIVAHHVDAKKIKRLQNRKAEIIAKYGIQMEEYVDSQSLFPKLDTVRSGNATEIILSQYLQKTTGLKLLAYKLTYNPNVDQAMKGDDCLLFYPDNLSSRIIVGEAKYRGTPTKAVVKEMISNLEGSKKIPISLPFISQHFSANGDEKMAAAIEDLQFEVSKGHIPITNVGLLLSTQGTTKSTDAAMRIEADLETSNPNLIILSLGTDNPKEMLEKAFLLAQTLLNDQV
jgi:hypothetical protein